MSARTKNNNQKKQRAMKVQSSNALNPSSVLNTDHHDWSHHPSLRQARSLIQEGDYVGAANLLGSAGRDPYVRNALGVCLIRAGQVDKAVDVYRSFVLMPGTVLERPDVSNSAKRNFATALLLKGFPSGTLSVLAEIRDPDHPMAVRLYAAIRQWEKSLSWFRRLDWKLNGVEPSNCKIVLDFEPGEFDFDVQAHRPGQPDKPRKSSLKLAA
ncbi:tetratricopeptide repeat protein [Neorhodopirellula pilleata]|uniref:Tetratricopeptide repeat protein n=1 Tax=Neorhodopirellula pilleata TaxID=2714738 RepID=A0A5C6AQI6_9BACT|nr:tetratricopeptide repeat protein [Neorhodopirellula pilleata]TWU01818.1 hypothetical protein Pla100_15540 [Neorhodopirellula pilleata]